MGSCLLRNGTEKCSFVDVSIIRNLTISVQPEQDYRETVIEECKKNYIFSRRSSISKCINEIDEIQFIDNRLRRLRKNISCSMINKNNQFTSYMYNLLDIKRVSRKKAKTDLSQFKLLKKERTQDQVKMIKKETTEPEFIASFQNVKMEEENIKTSGEKKNSISSDGSGNIGGNEEIIEYSPSTKACLITDLTKEQKGFVRKVLSKNNFVQEEMDDETVEEMLSIIVYYKTGKNTIVYSKEEDGKNLYFIIENGKIEYSVNKKLGYFGKGDFFGTSFFGKSDCSIKTLADTSLFCFASEDYKAALDNFYLRVKNEKMTALQSLPIFKQFDEKKVEVLSRYMRKVKYAQEEIISDEDIPRRLYIIISGNVIVKKDNKIIKEITKGEYFCDIPLFCYIESYYCYETEEEVALWELDYQNIVDSLGENYIKDLIFQLFVSLLKCSHQFSKHLNGNNLKNFFNVFSLKYYFNDVVCSSKDKKICIIISGRLVRRRTKEIVAQKGEVFGEELIDGADGPDFIFSEDECVVYEANWKDILKSLKVESTKNVSLYNRVSLMKNIPVLSPLSDWKLFQLAENLKNESFKDNELIMKGGDKFYIVKSGHVKVFINDVLIKEIDKYESFGEIITAGKSYSRPACFIARGKVECYSLHKEVIEEIIDPQAMTPVKKMMQLKDITIALDHLYFIKELGAGSYGKVFLVHNMKNYYAIKTAEIKTCKKDKIYKYYINEKSIMGLMNHVHIVNLVNTFKNKEHIFFLMEYIDGISFRRYLDIRNKDLLRNTYETQFYGAILFSAVNYMQQMRVIHRDLKPSNCMLNKAGYLKIIDFGVAKDMTGKDHTNSLVGTPHYMPPEMILGKGYNFSADYWSIGVIIYELFYGCLPFGSNSSNLLEIYDEITEKKISLPSTLKYAHINDLIKGLMNRNVQKRICSFKQIKAHDFFHNFNFDKLDDCTMIPPNKDKLEPKNLLGNDLALKDDSFLFGNFIQNEFYSRVENDNNYYASDEEKEEEWLSNF